MKLLFSIRAALTPVLITAGLLGGGMGFALADTPPVDASITPELSCANARFVKSITLARALIPAPPQDVLNLGAMLGDDIAATLEQTGRFTVVLTAPTRSPGLEQSSAWDFLGPRINPRAGTLDIALFNGQTPRAVANTGVNAAPIQAALFAPPIDALGAQFATSPYGHEMHQLAFQAAQWIDNQLKCAPLWGQVIARTGTELTINRGAMDGLRMSDRIQVLQRSDPLMPLGQTHLPNRYLMQRIGQADIAYLGERTAIIRLSGASAVQIGDVIQAGQ
ncbi:MAG: hypothetical protein B7Y58_08235 [Halothiobacillus sp. 35-54-62]|nr:MAG: hypothetical protein B7Y58_08235 [Halothiobacillus sp. 35-54-62]